MAGTSTAIPTTSRVYASSAIAPEIWLNIFQIATFIPGEWDMVGSRIDMGHFQAPYYFARPYQTVLPLRRSIVEVSRLWHKIGTKLLYASFECDIEDPNYRLAAFAHVLLARPYLGRLVKRLGLIWSPTITNCELIIRHCPNAIIVDLSSNLPRYLSLKWVRSLPESLRGLKASVRGIEMAEVMRILFLLPNLESLGLWDFEKEQNPSQYPRLHLPALRLLTLLFETRTIVKIWLPLLISLDAPKLTVLRTNIGGLSSAVSAFPQDLWERLTYLGVCWGGHRYFKSAYFLNLRHLSLLVEENQTVLKMKNNFPFHQLEKLTLSPQVTTLPDVTDWKPFLWRVLSFPLDTKVTPSLRVLELIWLYGGLEAAVKRHALHAGVMSKFLASLGSYVLKFEKRGVQFLEVRPGEPYHAPEAIREVVSTCKEHIQ